MAITRWRPRRTWWTPFGALAEIQGEMNRLFDTRFRDTDVFGDGAGLLERGWRPAVDIHHDDDKVVVDAELPGLKKEEIEIGVEDGVLTIKGEKKRENEVEEDDYYRVERVHGTFERSFRLPTTVDTAKITAKYKDGVLHVEVPKKEEAKPKQITVEVK